MVDVIIESDKPSHATVIDSGGSNTASIRRQTLRLIPMHLKLYVPLEFVSHIDQDHEVDDFNRMKSMKTNLLCMMFLAAFMLAGCDSSTPAKKADAESTAPSGADSEETAGVQSENTTAFLIDVRSQEEWDEGHIDSAIHIPHTEIVAGIAKVTDDKNAKICLH